MHLPQTFIPTKKAENRDSDDLVAYREFKSSAIKARAVEENFKTTAQPTLLASNSEADDTEIDE